MAPDRFDELVRSLILARSRRAVLGLTAGALAALGGAEAMVVEAKKKHHHKKKKKCKGGKKRCKKKCFDLQTDPEHCGSCDVACATGEACDSGQCVTVQGTCQAGDDACLGVGDPFCFDASGQSECICQTRLEGGTRCAYFGNASACDQCATDADCFALGFPPGSGCMLDFGGSCVACQDNNQGICAIPCGSPDPT